MKGQVYAWFVILIILFTFTLLYNIFTYPYILVHDNALAAINDTDSPLKADALNALDLVDATWMHWLLVLIFFLIVWGLAVSQRRDVNEYAY
jgi:uncharacterized membrane protein